MNLNLILSILFAGGACISGVSHIVAEYREQSERIYLLKPLTMVLIIAVAISADVPIATFYKAAIVLGLVLSLMGDIFLVLPGKELVTGLGHFLIAHLLYSIAFSSQTEWAIPSAWGLLLVGLGVVAYWQLSPYLRELKIPVALYTVVILLMAWTALEVWTQTGQTRAAVAFLGALLFVVSDAVLGANRFWKPFQGANGLILGTYYCAQLLIAYSIRVIA